MRPVSKIVLASAGAVVLGGGVVAGVALAQVPPATPGQGPTWLSRFAQALGKSETEVQQAAKTASTQAIDDAVGAGRLTAEQAQRLKDRLDQRPFAGPGSFGGPRGPHGPHRGLAGPGRLGGPLLREATDQLAQYLGLPPQDLQGQLRSGKSLAQIAQDRGKSRDDLKAFITTQASTRPDEAVRAGRLTQPQADQLKQRLSANIDQLIDRTPPLRPQNGQRQGPPAARPSA